MSSVSTYLNFAGNTEEAFNFYKQVFRTEFQGEIMRFRDVPSEGDNMKVEEKDLVMHVSLPILGGHLIMGTDATEAMGFKINFGNNVYINLEPDTREETDRLFKTLSEGGKIETPLQDMFWGDYYGSCTDRFGVKWMFNCAEKK
jgi:PhnB protein